MTRRRQRGRAYQPLPARHVNLGARLLVVFVAFVLVAGFAILTFTR